MTQLFTEHQAIQFNLQATELFIVTSAAKGEGGNVRTTSRSIVWFKILYRVI